MLWAALTFPLLLRLIPLLAHWITVQLEPLPRVINTSTRAIPIHKFALMLCNIVECYFRSRENETLRYSQNVFPPKCLSHEKKNNFNYIWVIGSQRLRLFFVHNKKLKRRKLHTKVSLTWALNWRKWKKNETSRLAAVCCRESSFAMTNRPY